MDRPVYFGGGRAFDFAFACDRATSGAAKPGNGASLSRARREGPRAGDPCNVARCAEHWRLNSGAFNLAALNSDQVRLTFLGHATFLIESPQLVRIASDYKDYVKSPLVPDIVTMNHAPTRITPIVPIRRSNTCCAVGARPPISRRIGT